MGIDRSGAGAGTATWLDPRRENTLEASRFDDVAGEENADLVIK